MARPGDLLSLTIEKAAAGGRMIARAEGQVVLVADAIPGERVTARVDRTAKGVLFATATAIDEPSPDRRPAFDDPACGGCAYSHVAYPRQLTLKADVIVDAFARIGKVELPGPVAVTPSPEEGYRMRARLHVRGRQVGFFREATHDVCDARATRQLLPETCDVLDRLSAGLRSIDAETVRGLELAENVDASDRAVHFEVSPGADARPLAKLADTPGLTGFGADASVTDTLDLAPGVAVSLRRHVLAFFQGNRFLLRDLVRAVVDRVPPRSRVVDLYAGTGLFAISAAVLRETPVRAVEGDRVSAADLRANAAAHPLVTPFQEPVESFVASRTGGADAIIVDPPRTGMSPEALTGLASLRPGRIVYVSCDVPTLARDARRLVEAGYRLTDAAAFDLFPNTPHVEMVAVFDLAR
jgi:23S rRNA (uracil1939-C5)-methyltransferase